jgi:hypothetical protein
VAPRDEPDRAARRVRRCRAARVRHADDAGRRPRRRSASLVESFLDHADLRARLSVCDPGRLERIGTVRSSVFVSFEWFLRDAYGVELLPSPAFTQGVIDRGIISLGMG